ncbi:MAG: hypothetical protein JNK85_23845 [Verrucomicrobiales bacterium]|nr:hypothetical protein [Verrucomicrobiales bacterium]
MKVDPHGLVRLVEGVHHFFSEYWGQMYALAFISSPYVCAFILIGGFRPSFWRQFYWADKRRLAPRWRGPLPPVLPPPVIASAVTPQSLDDIDDESQFFCA